MIWPKDSWMPWLNQHQGVFLPGLNQHQGVFRPDYPNTKEPFCQITPQNPTNVILIRGRLDINNFWKIQTLYDPHMSSNRNVINIKTSPRSIASPAKSPSGITIRSLGSKTQKVQKTTKVETLTQPTNS